MRVAPLLAGVVALLLGVVLIALTFVSSSVTIPASGGYVPVAPHPLGGGSVSVSWSGAPTATTIAAYHCGAACVFTSQTGCSGMPCTAAGGPIATGHGSSGTLSFSVDSSSSYALVAQGTSQPISASATLSGLTLLLLLGAILAILGLVLVVLARGGGTNRSAPMEGAMGSEEESPAEEVDDGVRWEAPVPTPVAAAPSPTRVAPPPRTAYVAPPPPPREEPEEEEAPAPAAPFKARPPIVCTKCGATNEPWLTQCRNCKRPLTSTAAV